MINLLPPQVKEDIRYARLNHYVIGYIKLIVFIAVVLAAAFGGTWYYLHQQIDQVKQNISDKQSTIATYASLQKQASTASDRLAAIAAIQSGQTKFSQVISDLAAYLPAGSSLSGISLTGQAQAPVQVTISANTYQTALAARDAIATSPRISGVDLVTVGATTGANGKPNGYSAQLVFAFKPGAAK